MTDAQFSLDRDQTLERILSRIQTRIDGITPPLITNIKTVAVTAMQKSSEREAWQLLKNGIQHLKDGAPGRQPGSLTEALSRASLRASSLAASIGIKPPQFAEMYYKVGYTTGHEAALFFTRRLVEAAVGDLSKSRQIISQKIYSGDMPQPDPYADIQDPELKRLFESTRQSESPGVIGPLSAEEIFAMRRQMVMSFNTLQDAYAQACKELLSEIAELQPSTKPPGKGPSF